MRSPVIFCWRGATRTVGAIAASSRQKTRGNSGHLHSDVGGGCGIIVRPLIFVKGNILLTEYLYSRCRLRFLTDIALVRFRLLRCCLPIVPRFAVNTFLGTTIAQVAPTSPVTSTVDVIGGTRTLLTMPWRLPLKEHLHRRRVCLCRLTRQRQESLAVKKLSAHRCLRP